MITKFEKFFYYPVRNFLRWKVWEPISPPMLKHYYQRARYGYSYRDNWSVDSWLLDGLVPMIQQLKDRKIGAPRNMYKDEDGLDEDGWPTENADYMATQRWNNILGEIVYGLKCAEYIKEDTYGMINTVPMLTKPKYKKMTRSIERSFNLMGEHLFDLWD